MVHQQESFHPFPSCNVSPAFFQTAKRELCITSYVLLSSSVSCVAKGGPKSHGSIPCKTLMFSFFLMAATTGFKSWCESSSASPFHAPSTSGYTCQHSHTFPAFLGCHGKSGQAWAHGVEPIFSKLSCRGCNQRGLPPTYITGRSHWHLPVSKLGHSYFTYL